MPRCGKVSHWSAWAFLIAPSPFRKEGVAGPVALQKTTPLILTREIILSLSTALVLIAFCFSPGDFEPTAVSDRQ